MSLPKKAPRNGKSINHLISQNAIQRRLIELQDEIIRLQKELEQLTPSIPDDDVNWNKVSNGLTSTQVLDDGNYEAVENLQVWVHTFGEKYVKPYVHHRVYAEIIAHMSRGISERLAQLTYSSELTSLNEIQQELNARAVRKKTSDVDRDDNMQLPIPFPSVKDADK